MTLSEVRLAKHNDPTKVIHYDDFYKTYTLIDPPLRTTTQKIAELSDACDDYLEDNYQVIGGDREKLILEAANGNTLAIENDTWKTNIRTEYATRKAALENGEESVSLDFSSFGSEPNTILEILA